MLSKLYIVVVNYNNISDTLECLESLLKIDYFNYQIILVDNSETDESLHELKKWCAGNSSCETLYPEIVYPLAKRPIDATFSVDVSSSYDNQILVIKTINKGFAAANNRAFEYIQNQPGESMIWLLNNDTVVQKGVVKKFMQKINSSERDLSVTIYGTPLLEYNDSNKIQAIGGKYNRLTGLTTHFGEHIDFDTYKNVISRPGSSVDYPVGASLIVSSAFIKKVGFLCEDYFLFYEELDWVYRAYKMGGGMEVLDVLGVYHKQGKSTNTKNKGTKSLFIEKVFLRSRILFAQKYNSVNLPLIYLSIITLSIGKRIVTLNFKSIPIIVKTLYNMILK